MLQIQVRLFNVPPCPTCFKYALRMSNSSNIFCSLCIPESLTRSDFKYKCIFSLLKTSSFFKSSEYGIFRILLKKPFFPGIFCSFRKKLSSVRFYIGRLILQSSPILISLFLSLNNVGMTCLLSASIINTVSSEHHLLSALCQSIINADTTSISLGIASLYKPYESGEKTHRCVFPLSFFFRCSFSINFQSVCRRFVSSKCSK